jgi:RNA polymerase sigma-70 factor, ECF subfamily
VVDGSDDALARAAATGNRASFAVLIERHYDRIFRLAWRWAGSRTEAEDIAQDVCVKLATAIKTFRGESAFTTWLYRIAFTTATDRLRARQRIIPFAPSDMNTLIDGATGETPESALIGAQLWDAVRALPDQQRDAVLLIYGEDLSHQEAATIMGCSEKTVSWHLHEARRRLKAKLERDEPHPLSLGTVGQ